VNPTSNNEEIERIKELHEQQRQTDFSDMEMFQTLFLAQLKAQDPLEPLDNTEFMSQMAQFTTVEQLTLMNTRLEELGQGNAFSEGAALIGKWVSGVSSENSEAVSGIVDSLKIDGDDVFLHIGNSRLLLNDIISVTHAPDTGGGDSL
jgi:flagellar basal-body rod modification protein FlgD